MWAESMENGLWVSICRPFYAIWIKSDISRKHGLHLAYIQYDHILHFFFLVYMRGAQETILSILNYERLSAPFLYPGIGESFIQTRFL